MIYETDVQHVYIQKGVAAHLKEKATPSPDVALCGTFCSVPHQLRAQEPRRTVTSPLSGETGRNFLLQSGQAEVAVHRSQLLAQKYIGLGT